MLALELRYGIKYRNRYSVLNYSKESGTRTSNLSWRKVWSEVQGQVLCYTPSWITVWSQAQEQVLCFELSYGVRYSTLSNWGQVICLELQCTVRYRDRYSVLIYSMESGTETCTLGTQFWVTIWCQVQEQVLFLKLQHGIRYRDKCSTLYRDRQCLELQCAARYRNRCCVLNYSVDLDTGTNTLSWSTVWSQVQRQVLYALSFDLQYGVRYRNKCSVLNYSMESGTGMGTFLNYSMESGTGTGTLLCAGTGNLSWITVYSQVQEQVLCLKWQYGVRYSLSGITVWIQVQLVWNHSMDSGTRTSALPSTWAGALSWITVCSQVQ